MDLHRITTPTRGNNRSDDHADAGGNQEISLNFADHQPHQSYSPPRTTTTTTTTTSLQQQVQSYLNSSSGQEEDEEPYDEQFEQELTDERDYDDTDDDDNPRETARLPQQQQQQQQSSSLPFSTPPRNNRAAPFAGAPFVVGGGDGDNKPTTTSTSTQIKMKVAADAPWTERLWEVFTTFWPLGFVAFGGPQAHVAILREHLVTKRDWISEEQFLELYAIGQGLPGPTSTQLVVSTALSRAGPLGGLLALFLWNMPGLIVLTACGILIGEYVDPNEPPWYLAGLPPAAISLVFVAFYGFAVPLDKFGTILALAAGLLAVWVNNDRGNVSPTASQWIFPTVMGVGALLTWIDSKRAAPFSSYDKSPNQGWDSTSDETMQRIGIPLYAGALIFAAWLVLLIVVIIVNNVSTSDNVYLEIFEVMYRVGSLIFGGGQVVLPLMQDEVVPHWMTRDQFLQGLGLAQSMPGPLFNIAAYLGAVYQGVPGALVAFVALFGPGVILIFAAVPFWARLRHNDDFKAILKGLNATAIGLVGAACITLWESAIVDSADAMIFSVALTMATVFNVDAPFCILAGGVLGAILHPDASDLGQVPYCIARGFGPLVDE